MLKRALRVHTIYISFNRNLALIKLIYCSKLLIKINCIVIKGHTRLHIVLEVPISCKRTIHYTISKLHCKLHYYLFEKKDNVDKADALCRFNNK